MHGSTDPTIDANGVGTTSMIEWIVLNRACKKDESNVVPGLISSAEIVDPTR